MISIFIFYEILRVIFHLQLLQNIGPIPCDGQYIHVAYLTPSSLCLSLLTPVMTLSPSSLITSSLLYVCLILFCYIH